MNFTRQDNTRRKTKNKAFLSFVVPILSFRVLILSRRLRKHAACEACCSLSFFMGLNLTWLFISMTPWASTALWSSVGNGLAGCGKRPHRFPCPGNALSTRSALAPMSTRRCASGVFCSYCFWNFRRKLFMSFRSIRPMDLPIFDI